MVFVDRNGCHVVKRRPSPYIGNVFYSRLEKKWIISSKNITHKSVPTCTSIILFLSTSSFIESFG